MKIVIDTRKVMEHMISNGITVDDVTEDNLDGWTDAFMEAIEDLYSAESKVFSEYAKQGGCI